MTDLMKSCKGCGETKPLVDNFYRAGKTYQSLCKPCHNKTRVNYSKNGPRKLRGFDALPEDRQNQIKEDAKIMTSKDAAEKNGIKYRTFLLWRKKWT